MAFVMLKLPNLMGKYIIIIIIKKEIYHFIFIHRLFCFFYNSETNLKCRQALPETAELSDNIDRLAEFCGEINCEAPNNNLTKFEGVLKWRDDKFSLDNDKMLLRGCRLRNTKWCFGVVIFAGRDTKLMQNSGKTIFKRTSLDRLLNLLILGVCLIYVHF